MLQMAALRLGEMESFPFLDPPDRRSMRDGVALLQELGAFDAAGDITDSAGGWRSFRSIPGWAG